MTTPATLDIPFHEQQQPEVQAALEDHAQAADFLAALEERVRAGDDGVKPAELREARGLVEYAELRVAAAQRAARQRQAGERAAQYRDLGDRLRSADVVPDDEIMTAFTEAITGLDRLISLAVQRSNVVKQLGRRTAALVQIADEHGERDQLRAAGVHNGNASGIGNQATVIGFTAEGERLHLTDANPQFLALAALGRASLLAGLDLPPEVSPIAAVDNAARDFPGIATATPATQEADAA